jgi:hypothetical protein
VQGRSHTPQRAFGFLLSQSDPKLRLGAATHIPVSHDTVHWAVNSVAQYLPDIGGNPDPYAQLDWREESPPSDGFSTAATEATTAINYLSPGGGSLKAAKARSGPVTCSRRSALCRLQEWTARASGRRTGSRYGGNYSQPRLVANRQSVRISAN